ncbi:MAG TPA: hypothetical protein VMT94_01290 [Burkholderiales bacterium]|nr:hypothetical protein [Burkholderiales bacterium]
MRAYFQRHDSALPGAEIPNQTSSKANGKMRLLPDALERKLSVLPANYLRALSGDSVLLVETVTHTVIDRMRNVRSKSEWGTMQHRAGYESANSAA